MNDLYDENNPHTLLDEQQGADEEHAPTVPEWQASEETYFPVPEVRDDSSSENKNKTSKQAKQDNNIKQVHLLSKILAGTTITCTAGAALVTSIVTPAPVALHVIWEEAGFHNYVCSVDAEAGAQYEVFLESNMDKSQHFSFTGEAETTLLFENLRNACTYRMTVKDANGKTCLSHNFTTDNIVTLGEMRDGIIPVTLHEEVLAGLTGEMVDGEMHLQLFDETDYEYWDNLTWGEYGDFCIDTYGLYTGTYYFSLAVHMPDSEPVYYKHTFSLITKDAPSLEVLWEDIGFNKYSCTIDADVGVEYTVRLESDTDDSHSITVTGEGETTLSFEDLRNACTYRMIITDDQWREHPAHVFTTDDFVTLGEAQNGMIPIILHEVLTSGEGSATDMGLLLTDEDGKDFSGSLVRDADNNITLHTDGLFTGIYSLEAMLHISDYETRTYVYSLTLGDLTPLDYTMETTSATDGGLPTDIMLTQVAGDLGAYTTFDVTIEGLNSNYHRSISSENISMETGTFYISIGEELPAGEYYIKLWGDIPSDGENTINNQIWQGHLIIEEPTNP